MVVGERAVGYRGVQWDWEQGEEGKDHQKGIAGQGSERRFDTHGRRRKEG
jgi:hypothetical protein